VQHDTDADFAPFIMGHLSPQQPFAFLWAATSRWPSLQQPWLQHELPSGILPPLPIGHLSPEQHAQALAMSPVARPAGATCVDVCAIIAGANSIVTTTINNFVFIDFLIHVDVRTRVGSRARC
jgi:hypothetical protein